MGEVDAEHGVLARHVRSALGSLYDPVSLEHHPLACLLDRGDSDSPSGPALRNRLLEAIDALKPGRDATSRSRAWRPYTLLRLRYIEARDPVEVQRELAMSKSQYYREHEHEEFGKRRSGH